MATEARTTFLLNDTEGFMRGELDNVTVANGRILLDMVQGAYVPYGCYTSPAIPMPAFDALRVSWNAATPPGTAVEVQARVMVDGNWSAWSGFGRWSPYLQREGAKPMARGPLVLHPDFLTLDSKTGAQVQVRIYLYTREDKRTPAVHLLAASVRAVGVIPAGGRPVNARLHLMPYVVARRAPALRAQMDLAISLASLTNRWGADILPEEFALALRDHSGADNFGFAAAAAGSFGFPAWVRWADLAALRAEVRAGFGAVVALDSTPAQQAAGLPPLRYAALRGFATVDGTPHALLCDPWAGEDDFDAETSLPLDDFMVAWNNQALFMRNRPGKPDLGCPVRASVWVRPLGDQPGLFGLHINGALHPLPPDFCGRDAQDPEGPALGGVLAYTITDDHPHATTAHKRFAYTQPEQGGIRLPANRDDPKKFTVYAIDQSGCMLVGDITT